MAKEKLSLIRIIFTGIIWTFVYLQVISSVCYYVFDFNILMLSDWVRLFHRFASGLLVVDTFWDFCLFGGLLLFIPMWIWGWFFCARVRWRRYLPTFKTRRAIQKKIIKKAQAKKPFVPAKLRVQSSALLGVNPLASSDHHEVSSSNESHSPVVKPMINSYSDEEDIQSLLPLVKEISSADFFPHISLNGHYASFALSTEKKAAVVTLLNDSEARWSVDTTSSLEQGDWYSETRVLKAPLVDVVNIAEQLKQADEGAVAVPVMVLMSGTILNIAEVKDYLDAQGIILTRLDSVESEDIPLFSDFLQIYFDENEEAELDVSEDWEDEHDEDESEGDLGEESEIYENNWDESDEGIPEPEENV